MSKTTIKTIFILFALCLSATAQPQTITGKVLSREDAKVWIIRNQFGRRNLPTYERGRLALTLEAIFREKAKGN
jgi:hypothetical protein